MLRYLRYYWVVVLLWPQNINYIYIHIFKYKYTRYARIRLNTHLINYL